MKRLTLLAVPVALAVTLSGCFKMIDLPREASVSGIPAPPISGFPAVRLNVADRSGGLKLAGPPTNGSIFKLETPVELTVRRALETEFRRLGVPVVSGAACTLDVAINTAVVQWQSGFHVPVQTMVELKVAALDAGNNVVWQKGGFIGGSYGTASAGCCGEGEANRGLVESATEAATKLGGALNDPALLAALRGGPASVAASRPMPAGQPAAGASPQPWWAQPAGSR